MRRLQANLNDQNRPISAVHDPGYERQLSDRKAVVRVPRSVRQLIANSGHSPLSGVGIEDHLNLVIEFDLQAYFNAATNKTL